MKISCLQHRFVWMVCTLVFSTPAILGAQVPAWTSTGPFGGTIPSLVAHPTLPGVLYGTVYDAGVLRTRDGGGSWELLPQSNGISLIAIDPSQPKTLYGASLSFPGKILKSADEGVHWTIVSRNLPANVVVTSLVADPSQPQRIYLGSPNRGVWRSADGGVTWKSVSRQLPVAESTSITALVVPKRPAGTVIVGTPVNGVYRSRDAGGSWEPLRTGLPTGYVLALASAPSEPKTLYASYDGPRTYRSRDGGDFWVAISAGKNIASLAVHPRAPLTVYGGTNSSEMLKTTDGGKTWRPTTPPPSPLVLTPVLDAAAAVYAGTVALSTDPGGVVRSVNGGASWERRNRGLVGLRALAVATDPADTDNLVTAMQGPGIYRSANAGTRWVPVRGFPAGRIVDSVTSEVIAAGPGLFYFVDLSTTPRIWKTADSGLTWNSLAGPPGRPQIVRADPSDPETLYAIAFSANVAGLFRSGNGGVSWTPVATLPATCAIYEPGGRAGFGGGARHPLPRGLPSSGRDRLVPLRLLPQRGRRSLLGLGRRRLAWGDRGQGRGRPRGLPHRLRGDGRRLLEPSLWSEQEHGCRCHLDSHGAGRQGHSLARRLS